MNIRVHLQGIMGLICGLALLGSLVHAQKGEAATYYVATDGSDSNPGTEARPFQTLGGSVGKLGPGDTLYVKNGTYTGSLSLIGWPSGTSWDNPVTLAAYPGHSPVIRTQSGISALYLSYISYIVIDGFFIDGTNGYDTIKITTGSSHIRIQNSEIAYSLGNGIVMNNGADGNELLHLQVHNNGKTGYDHGIYIASSDNIVEGCSIHDNSGYGVHVYNGSSLEANNNVIRSNEIYNNGWSGSGAGILLSSGDGNQANNNAIWGNNYVGGIYINYGASNTYVGGNTIYQNTYYGIYIGSGSSNAFIGFNSIYDNYGLSIVNEGVSTQLLP
jgi:parallel beta-helix repeat protein